MHLVKQDSNWSEACIESEEIRHDLGGARRHFELMSTRLPWATAATAKTATVTPATENEIAGVRCNSRCQHYTWIRRRHNKGVPIL